MNIVERIAAIIPHDKALHALAGGYAAALGVALAHTLHMPPLMAAVLTAALVGVLKELVDAVVGGDVSVWDAVATTLGSVPVALVVS